ncbi:RNB domain-containing ribonuclease [Agromyces seonyuensis]|uniref:RNB domain-containing ribonuclease n=1 Tax=Agromyces seonyuensis TaxID=2662446 RepID=A0A6I4P019_9MICO|nr:RNB domain-containing ribonuclease [Agromyces seonyuensis]MWB99928.1 RNB domain-containing ribonuclease [Agromyces seonyuensis]
MTHGRAPRLDAAARRGALGQALAELRTQLELPDGFAPDVLADAERSVREYRAPETDLTGIPFVTIDPPGSLDLDQAFAIERLDRGRSRVRYAIADVPGFVVPGSPLDLETRRRGQTLYGVDDRIPLHPTTISEDAASLLPGLERGAYVWEFDLDADGAVAATRLQRARVRSRARLDYATAQAALDSGGEADDSPLVALADVGRARLEQEARRGGASLNTPEIDVERDGADDGPGYRLVRREVLPVEEWNAQLSLMTGMAAAGVMLAGGIGILRTMPPASDDAIAAFRRRTVALGRPWPDDERYGDYLRRLDRRDPTVLAVLDAATELFRGAGYTVVDGEAPEHPEQSALAAPYAHVTAPLRRLVDRWGLVLCERLLAGGSRTDEEIAWAVRSLGELPPVMRESSRLGARWNGAGVARVEAAVLADRLGETFRASVVDVEGGRAELQLVDPAVTARCDADPGWNAGQDVDVVLRAADIASGSVRFDRRGEGFLTPRRVTRTARTRRMFRWTRCGSRRCCARCAPASCSRCSSSPHSRWRSRARRPSSCSASAPSRRSTNDSSTPSRTSSSSPPATAPTSRSRRAPSSS